MPVSPIIRTLHLGPKYRRIISTHHYRHAGCLHNGRQTNYQTKDTPPIFAQPFPATQDDEVCDYAYALQNDSKGHQEPDGAPHGAEVPVFAMAVFALWEALAGIGEGGAAAVKAVGVMVVGL